jgi:hypothetical protein
VGGGEENVCKILLVKPAGRKNNLVDLGTDGTIVVRKKCF